MNFGKFLAIIISDIYSASSFLYLWYSNYTYISPSESTPQFLDILFCLFLFHFAFQFRKFLLIYFQAHEYFWHVQSVDEPIKNLLYFCYSFWFLVISFWCFSWNFPLSPYFTIWFCMLSTFFTKAWTLIVVILNSLSSKQCLSYLTLVLMLALFL